MHSARVIDKAMLSLQYDMMGYFIIENLLLDR